MFIAPTLSSTISCTERYIFFNNLYLLGGGHQKPILKNKMDKDETPRNRTSRVIGYLRTDSQVCIVQRNPYTGADGTQRITESRDLYSLCNRLSRAELSERLKVLELVPPPEDVAHPYFEKFMTAEDLMIIIDLLNQRERVV